MTQGIWRGNNCRHNQYDNNGMLAVFSQEFRRNNSNFGQEVYNYRQLEKQARTQYQHYNGRDIRRDIKLIHNDVANAVICQEVNHPGNDHKISKRDPHEKTELKPLPQPLWNTSAHFSEDRV